MSNASDDRTNHSNGILIAIVIALIYLGFAWYQQHREVNTCLSVGIDNAVTCQQYLHRND